MKGEAKPDGVAASCSVSNGTEPLDTLNLDFADFAHRVLSPVPNYTYVMRTSQRGTYVRAGAQATYGEPAYVPCARGTYAGNVRDCART
jgi:hypothetical protein